MGFPVGLVGKESACNAGESGPIPVSGRSPGAGHGNPFQYSRLVNPMGREARWPTVNRVENSWTCRGSCHLQTMKVSLLLFLYGFLLLLFLP